MFGFYFSFGLTIKQNIPCMECMLSYGEALGTNLVWMRRTGEGSRRNPMGLKEGREAKSSGAIFRHLNKGMLRGS